MLETCLSGVTTYSGHYWWTRLESTQNAELLFAVNVSFFTEILEIQWYSNVHNAIKNIIEILMQLGIFYWKPWVILAIRRWVFTSKFLRNLSNLECSELFRIFKFKVLLSVYLYVNNSSNFSLTSCSKMAKFLTKTQLRCQTKVKCFRMTKDY